MLSILLLLTISTEITSINHDLMQSKEKILNKCYNFGKISTNDELNSIHTNVYAPVTTSTSRADLTTTTISKGEEPQSVSTFVPTSIQSNENGVPNSHYEIEALAKTLTYTYTYTYTDTYTLSAGYQYTCIGGSCGLKYVVTMTYMNVYTNAKIKTYVDDPESGYPGGSSSNAAYVIYIIWSVVGNIIVAGNVIFLVIVCSKPKEEKPEESDTLGMPLQI